MAGGIITPPSKQGTVFYNQLNLPERVVMGNSGNIYYHYDAAGNKLAKYTENSSSSENTTTEYIANLVYTNGKKSFFSTEEGRAIPIVENGKTRWHYEYNLKDHLGNTRATLGGSNIAGAADIVQTNSYYPFGMVMTQQNYNSGGNSYQLNKYLYNGKELQANEFEGASLDWYDYGARFYDPSLARWTTQDPLSESYYGHSPFHFSGNNPIRFLDLNGMNYGDYYDSELNYLGTDGIEDDKKYVVTNNEDVNTLTNNEAIGQDTDKNTLSGTEVELASNVAINAMEKAYNDSNSPTSTDPNGGFHEEGGSYGKDGNGNTKAVAAKPGAANLNMTAGSKASIKTLTPADPSQVTSDYVIEGTYHVHPGGTKQVTTPDGRTGIASFRQIPSQGDFNKASSLSPRGYSYTNGRPVTGNHYVIGARNNAAKGGGRVYIYNSNGNVVNVPRDNFFNLGH